MKRFQIAMSAVLVLLTTVQGFAQLSFSPAASYVLGDNPYFVSGDLFNGDGFLDLVVVNRNTNNVAVLLGTGSGTFSSSIFYDAGSYPGSVTCGDFNTDSNIDLATANIVSGNLSVLMGNGAGSFGSSTAYPAGSQAVDVVSGLFNGDAHLDLVVANYGANNISFHAGVGDGSFGAPVTHATGVMPSGLLSEDFNGDTYLDVAVANYGTGNLTILLGNGDGTFTNAGNHWTGTQPCRMVADYFDADANLDLAVVNFGSADVTLFFGDGAGGFTTNPAWAYHVGDGPQGICVGDMNLDEIPDLITANRDSDNISVLLGLGDGTFDIRQNFTVGSEPVHLLSHDFDGDGRDDLAVVNKADDNLYILLNDTPWMSVTNLQLSATSPEHTSDDDLICGYDLTGTATTAAVTWYRDTNPIMSLYLPFEGGLSNSLNDYSGSSTAVTTFDDPTWTWGSGHNGTGAYQFDGSDHLDAGSTFPTSSSYTKTAWVYWTGAGNYSNIMAGYTHAANNHCLKVNPDGTLNAGHSAGSAFVQDSDAILEDLWYFIAVTYDYDTREMILYKNGAPVDQTIVSTTYQDVTDSGLLVGAMYYNWKWRGYIDEPRVYADVLSPEQIAAMAGRPTETVVSQETTTGETWHCVVTPFSSTMVGDPAVSNTLLIATEPLVAPTITSTPITDGTVWTLYTYDVDASGNPAPTYSLETYPIGMTIDPVSGIIQWTPDSNGDFSVTVRAENSEGFNDQGYVIHVPLPACQIANLDIASTSGNALSSDELSCGFDLTGTSTTAAVAWEIDSTPMMELFLPFEGGADVSLRDFSGHNLAVTIHSDPTWLPTGGHNGTGAYEFDGDDFLIPEAVFPTFGSYTKTAWIYRSGDSYNGIMSGQVHTSTDGHCFRVPPSGHMDAGHNGNWSLVVDPDVIEPLTWYFVAVTYDYSTSELILYRDGVAVDSAVLDALHRDVSDPIVYVGATMQNFEWEGVIDDPRIYARALSPQQITALHGSRAVSAIASNETSVGEVWQARVTPFSTSEVGVTYSTGTLTIQPVPAEIVSLAVTSGSAGSPYTYDVEATGDPAPTYALTVYPTGMIIDPASGLIEWIPAAGGDYDVTVVASNFLASDDQPYVIHVVEPLAENLDPTSTSGMALPEDDLTISYDLSGDAVAAAVAWHRNGAPLGVLLMPFEGGGSALMDLSGNSHTVTVFDDPVWQMSGGHNGNGAFEFDGGDHLDAGNIFPTLSSYTKTAWVYRTGTSYNNIMAGYTHELHNHCFKVNPDGRLNAGHSGGSYHAVDLDPLLPSTWYFVAVTYDYDTHEMILYKNGSEVDRATISETYWDVTDSGLLIGAMLYNWKWQGMMDDVRPMTTWSPEQILAMSGRASETMVSQETSLGEQWQACVTPFSTSGYGVTECSQILTVQPPASGFAVNQRAQYDLIAVTQGVDYRYQSEITYSITDGTGAFHEVEVDVGYDPAFLAVAGVTQDLGEGVLVSSDDPVSGLLNIVLTISGTYDPSSEEDIFSVLFESAGSAVENLIPGTDVIMDSVVLRDLLNQPIQCDIGDDVNIRLDGTGPTPNEAVFPVDNCLNSEFSVGTNIIDNCDLESISYSFDGVVWQVMESAIPGTTWNQPLTIDVSALADGAGHTLHLRACDVVGNITNSTPPSWVFQLDRVAPEVVSDLCVTPWPVEPYGQLRCRITWSNTNTSDDYELYRAQRPGYPYFGGLLPETIWGLDYVKIADVPAGTVEWIDDSWTGDTDPQRGVHDYRLVQVDCVNASASSNIDSATNYLLGDCASNNGVVDGLDLTTMAGCYGSITTEGVSDAIDVGPTSDWSSYGLPLVDGVVDFEDMMVFSLNYGPAGPDITPATYLEEHIDKREMASAESVTLLLGVSQGKYTLTLSGNLRGFSARLVTANNLVSAEATNIPVMSYRDGDTWILDVVSLEGDIPDQSVVTLGFEGDDVVVLEDVEGRDSINNPVCVTAENAVSVPTVFVLKQNYPNPFNPVTKIRYGLATESNVKLSVYNTLGREIVTLVSEEQAAGYYTVEFSGESLSSGVYIYRLQAGQYVSQCKMMLIK